MAIRSCNNQTFQTFDDVALFYRHWPAINQGSERKAIVLLHRGHEHSGRLQHIVDELNLPDFDFFAWDARGHGQSPGARGHSPSFGSSVRDLDTFIRHIGQQHDVQIENLAVIAQSVGAVLAATWVHDYAPKIRALTLAAPAFKIKLYIPFARSLVRLRQKLTGQFFVNSYVKARFLTHDPERIASFKTDPLISRPIASHILLALYETADRVIQDAGAIQVPTQMLVSGADFVVHAAPQHRFFDRLGSSIKEKHELPGFYHDLLGEKDRAQAMEKIHHFIIQRFAAQPSTPDLLTADQQGYTFEEYRQVGDVGRLCLGKRIFYALARGWLRSGGKLSNGIRLGVETGFDSGSTLDYVYRNQAQGKLLIGKAIDRNYLDQIGWRGIRQRKLHLEELLGQAWQQLATAEQPVHLVDIAAGHGRYVLDTATQLHHKQPAASILLRDYSPINVAAGRKLIHQAGLDSIARFEEGNAFARESLAQLNPAPTLAVVSGLYELFPENKLILDSLRGLAEAMPDGSYLVYTNQPWHPQIEFIAQTLSSHRGGQSWVMRRRTQAEMDALVAMAGFQKLDMRIDEWGIFTVSIAQRVHES